MKNLLFVLVTVLSTNAMALDVLTTVKASQASAKDSSTEYDQVIEAARSDAAAYRATGQVRPNLKKAMDEVRAKESNLANAPDAQVVDFIIQKN